MKYLLLNDKPKQTVSESLKKLAKRADRIEIAVAFFCDGQLLKSWLKEEKKIVLVVTLRPPTSYEVLKDILPISNLELRFLGHDFHSKMVLFYENGESYAAVVGSSNFTSNGLTTNLETNIQVTEPKVLKELSNHFDEIYSKSAVLQPTDLGKYEEFWRRFLDRKKEDDIDIKKLEAKIKPRLGRTRSNLRLGKVAQEYLQFWKCVDSIKSIVAKDCKTKFPVIPVYFVLDNFLYWISEVSEIKPLRKSLKEETKASIILKFFRRYVSESDGPDDMWKQSKNYFQKYLAENKIDSLSEENANTLFQKLHCYWSQIRWGVSPDSFTEKNDIKKIRGSLKYLLHSNEDISTRIHWLLKKDGPYKLVGLAESGVQELNGWVHPNDYPIRNEKADKGILLLGYTI